MKNTLVFTALLCLTFSFVNAQQTVEFSTEDAPCGFDMHMHELLENNPEEVEKLLHDDAQITELSQHVAQRAGEKNVFPVVVHILHSNGVGDIDFNQVENAIELLNAHYRREHADTSVTRSIFKADAGSAPFEFRLAQTDPNGFATNGVVRLSTSDSYNADDGVKSLSVWPTDRYFNIWIVNSIDNNGGSGIILGYAQFPGTGSWNTYGLVMRHDQFGVIGTAQGSDGMTLVHEMGHCLGLYHTFQSGCGNRCNNSGDRVCDTPPVSAATYDCSTSRNSCSNDVTGSAVGVNGETISLSSDMPDQIENYMSYNTCQNMFTIGQVSRMVATYNYYSRLQGLASESNLKAAGVSGLNYAEFSSSSQVICAGGQISFNDESRYDAKTFEWTFDGGEPATSTSSRQTVNYNEPGIYNVSMKVSDGDTTTIRKSKQGYVAVFSPVGEYLPTSHNFVSPTSVERDWVSINPDGDASSWEHNASVGKLDNSSYMMNNFNNETNRVDELHSETYDFSPFQEVTVSFDYALGRKATTDNDRLFVYVTNDCGESWTPIYSLSSSNATTSTVSPSAAFVPTSSEWASATFTISEARVAGHLVEGVRLKFEFTSGGGNNFYLDNINISGEYKDYPILVSPANESVVQETEVSLDWKSMDVDEYEFEFDEYNGFLSTTLRSGTKTRVNLLPDGDDTKALMDNLDQGKTYYWRVRGIKNGQPTQWSEVREFTVSATASVEANVEEALKAVMYPNPTTGKVHIELQGADEAAVRVVSLNGVEVASEVVLGNGVLDLSQQPSGVYLIEVISDSQVLQKRIIKQ